jgi:putative PEP-CTERM system TPR-repeat lipoprotein
VSADAYNGTNGLKDAVGMDIEYARADHLLAIARFGNEDYEGAVESAAALLKKRPDSPVPYNLLAAVRERQGDVEKALRLYQKALALDSDNATAMYNVARLNWKAGAVAGARERFERVVSQEPESIPVLLALSRIAIAEDRLDDAVSLLRRARAADPEVVNVHLALADVYGRQGRMREALDVAEEAVGFAADDPVVLMALGRAQLAAERPTDALVTLRKLTELSPDSPDAHFEFARACLQADHGTSARLALTKVLELDPQHLGAKVGLGTLALREGNTDKAMELAKEIQNTQPGLAAGHTLQGDLYMAQQKPRDAVGSYEKALKNDPDTKLVLKLVEAHRLAGDARAADDTLNRWLRAHPDDVETRVVRAAAHVKTGNTQAAIKDYETALELQPNHATALNELAWLYYRKGDPRALEMAEHAHSLLPDRPEVLDAYGWLLVENDQVARGMTLLKKALSKAPDDPQIRYHLVGALARDGQRERAREELETLLRSDQDFLDREAARRLLEDLR